MAGFSIVKGDGPRPKNLVTSDYTTADVADEAFWAHPRAMAAAPELMSGLETAIAEIERLAALAGEPENTTAAALRQRLDEAKAFPISFIDSHDQKVFSALLHGHVIWSKVGKNTWHTTPRMDGAVGIVQERDGQFFGSTKIGFSEPCKPVPEELVFATLEDARQAIGLAMAVKN
jgi:hypothetical protein